MTTQSESTPPRFHDRVLKKVQRLALSWQARRQGLGEGVAVHAESDFVRVDEGARRLYLPHVRHAVAFKGGIRSRLELVAEKYLGKTGYAPREGDVVLDIGAGIGEFSVWCAEAGAQVIAFEPDPLAFACLEKNTAALGSVQAYPYALWKERANLRLHGSFDTSDSSLIEDGQANSRNTDVEAWPLDALPFISRLAVVDLMKIDGEGVEPEIIAAGTRTLRRTRVVAIDVGAIGRRPNLKSRVETAIGALNFRSVPNERNDTVLALNVSMVGPVSNHVLGRRDS